MIDYRELAKQAALEFLKNEIPLTDSIAKLAVDNDLNPTQIQRVAELSNKATHRYCMLKSADKNFTFELANGDKIMEKISGMSIEPDFATSSFEPSVKLDSEKLSFLMGSPEPDFDIVKATKEQDRSKLAEMIDLAISDLDSKLTMEWIEKDAEEQSLQWQIKQLKEFGLQPEDIRQTLCSAMPAKVEEINKIMKNVGVEPSGTPVKDEVKRILNPKHPVVITVGNIFSKLDSITNLSNAKEYLNSQKSRLAEPVTY